MPRPRPTVPPYRHHKASGQAITVVDGRMVYLGPHGSAASKEKHARIVRDALAGIPAIATAPQSKPPPDLTVAGVLAAFWNHAKTAYPCDPALDGKRPPGEIGNFHDAMRPVLKLLATTPAAEFGPKALAVVQAQMVAGGLRRR